MGALTIGMGTLEQTEERYLRSARLTRGPEGIRLWAISWEGERERICGFPLSEEGDVIGEPEVGEWQDAIVALDHQCPPEPGSETELERGSEDGLWRVRVKYESGWSTVIAQRNGDQPVVVWRARGIAACPDIVARPDGGWVAFHHNVREDTGEPDIAKWIALRYVNNQGEVFQPTDTMKGRDRDLDGEEQSFEFPKLVVSEQGAVTILGRGSHDYWRQDLSNEGYTERVSLTDGVWGSRGRRVAAVRLDSGAILVAHRERKGYVIEQLAAPTGASPELTRSLITSAPLLEEDKERRPREGDPMARVGRITLFGDIQQHSAHSDGVGCADESYLRARYRYGDDFVALTDHESFLGKRTGPGEWRYLQDVALEYDDPGRFATLIAYEWTGRRNPGPGHKCVYLPKPGLPIVSRDDVPEGEALVKAIHGMGGIASPHHIGWTGCDEAGHQPEGQPVWEICSCHGCYEYADHPLGQRGDLREQLVDAMLKKGHRFGFTAASDSHGLLWHPGESRKRDPYRTGLTAVQATSCTRDAIMEAIRTRRCYATSGVPILLDFQVDGAPMGSELNITGPVRATAEAFGTDVIEKLELVGPRGVIEVVEGDSKAAHIEANVDAPYVYARVTQRDGEMAWSSPVFLDCVKDEAAQ